MRAVCGTPFTGGKRVMEGEDGNAYCERDFIDTYGPRVAFLLRFV